MTAKRLLRSISLLAALLFSTHMVLAGPAFAVAPDRVNIDLSKSNTLVFLVKNTGDQLIHLRIRPEFLPLGKNSGELNVGTSALSKTQEMKTSLVPYTIVSPQAVSLQPTEKREVRVSVRVPKNLKPGSYREHLAVRMLEFINKQRIEKNQNGKQIGLQLNLLMQVSPAIYGNLGNNQAALKVRCSVNSQGYLVLHASNETPWNFTGWFQIYKPGNTTKALNSFVDPVLRNSNYDIQTKFKPNTKQLLIEWRNDQSPSAPIGQTTCQLNT